MQAIDLYTLDSDLYYSELDDQAEYKLDIGLLIDEFETDLNATNPVQPSPLLPADKLIEAISKLNFSDGKPPSLECVQFSGREQDKFAFHNFLNQFNNVIGSRKSLSKSAKQSYLYSYLRGYALKLVSHLVISDTNYETALQMLKDEFLDIPYIKDETLKNLYKASPSSDCDNSFSNVKLYINEIRAYLYELKVYNVDFLEEGTAGNLFVSHLVFNKLPGIVKKEFIHTVGNNYPTINQVIDHYREVIQTLCATMPVKRIF